MKALTYRLLPGVALAALCGPFSAHAGAAKSEIAAEAAEAEDQDGTQDAEPSRAQEIIVTAQRRSQSLQDVPVTVTVFGAEEIEDARIQQIGDVVTRTPGLAFDAYPATQPRLFIRGIGSSDRGAAGDPSTAVFLDEIYLGRPAAIAFDAFDIERIEVLKGPQGTLFGRNVVGGAINVVTRRPELASFDAGAEFTYGNFNRIEGAAYVNMPFAGNTGAVRLSGAYRSHDGYTFNPYLGADIDDQDTLSGRLQISGEPSDSFRFHLTVDGTRDRMTGPANHTLELDASDPLSNFYTPNFDPDVTYGSTVGYQDRDTFGVRAELQKDLGLGTLTFLGSYRKVEYSTRYDLDGGNPDPTSPGYNDINIAGGDDETAELSSQELRLSSLPGSKINWVVGFYHYSQTVERTNEMTLDAPIVAPFTITEVFDNVATLDSIAFFGDASIPVTDKLSVFGGLRWTKDDKRSHVWNTRSLIPVRAEEFFDVTAEGSFDAVTWRAGVEFSPSPDHMFYASVSRGFKSGGFQDTPANADEAARPFLPEKATQYEIGQKSSFWDRRIVWNNTLFYVDYTDLQTSQLVGGQFVVSNAGQARVQGYETQLVARPVDGLNLSASYAYTDAKFVDFVEGGTDYSGNRLSRAPKHKLTLSPSYTYRMASGVEITAAADYLYTSEIFDDNSNQPPELRGPSEYIDARLIIDGIADHWSLSIWGKNLTDERARTWQGTNLGANFGAFSPPRTYGATLRWNY